MVYDDAKFSDDSGLTGDGSDAAPLVISRISGPVAYLTLNRPDALNALNEPLADAMVAAVEAVKQRSDVRVVVLQGAGRAFCSGGDLSMLDAFRKLSLEAGAARMMRFYKRFMRLRELEVPVVASIHGSAIGAGACLTLVCDVRVATEEARIGFNFLKLGLHPGLGATELLPQTVGEARATELLLTGRTLTGREAAEVGLVHTCVAADALEKTLAQVTADLAATGPLAMRLLKQRLKSRVNEAQLEAALQFEALSQARCYQTWDFQEGIRAAREKRRPAFEDR